MKQPPSKQIMIVCTVMFMLFERSASSQPLPKEFISVVGRSHFIFLGTVALMDSSNVNVHSTRKTAIVRVDNVFDAPMQYPPMKGREVTVFFADSSTYANGEQSVFYTAVSSVGRTLALNEVKNSLNKKDQTDLKRRIIAARELIADDSLLAQLKRSELIVVGTVVNPRADTSRMYYIRSEHNPAIIGASIKIKKQLKGHISQEKVLAYYASSEDVLWYRAAKLSKKMDGIFLLHTGNTIPIFNSAGYVVLDPRDVQSVYQLKKIKLLLKK